MKGYFDYVVNSALALRRLTSIHIENPEGTPYSMRPQMHLFVCQPFGTGKSAVFKQIKAAIDGDCEIVDDFTKPAFQGTVGKDRGYVPGIVNRIGGKVLCIDEWNSVTSDGRAALLSVLENNSFNRNLGFSVKKEIKSVADDWTNITVKDGNLFGSINFTCIAGAMYFPRVPGVPNDQEREEALLSRFTPYFRSFSVDDVLEMKDGKLYNGFEDNAPVDLRTVGIPGDCTYAIQEAYNQYIETRKFEFTERQVGYISRVWVDFVRLGVANAIPKTQGEFVVLDDPAPFLQDMEWHLDNQFAMYTHKDTKTTEERFLALVATTPNMAAKWYANQLGVTTRTIDRYKTKNNIAWMKTGDEDESETPEV